MALYTIGDLHLSLGTNKPMDVFKGWTDYVNRLTAAWNRLVDKEDTVVLAGDLSWGMTLEESLADFCFIDRLPGKKILLKGNHDYWWSTKSKMDKFFAANGLETLQILHNNHYACGGIAVCGTRGWNYDSGESEDKKVLLREVGRLKASLESVRDASLERVVFLHYPPVYAQTVCEEIAAVLDEYGVKRCYYGHIHGAAGAHAVTGLWRGIELRLVSCDYAQFTPQFVRDF